MVRSMRAVGMASLLTCAVICGCDPGYVYDPTDAKGQIVSQWSETIDGVTFSAGTLQMLVGDTSASYDFDVVNNSDKTVVVSGGEVVTKSHTMKVTVDEKPSPVFPPQTSGYVNFTCKFVNGSEASEIAGETMTWTIRVKIGKNERSVSVTMKQH